MPVGWPSRGSVVFAALVVLVGCPVVGPGTARADGPDAGGGHWAQESVRFISELGLYAPAPPGGEESHCDAGPTPPGAHEPGYDAALTASEWNAMVCRLFGAVPGDDRIPGSLRHWLWCYSGAFGTAEGVERGHAVGAFMKILNMYGLEDLSALEPPRLASRFADWAEVPDSQDVLVEVAGQNGLIEGFPDRTLRPRQYLTLGEAATFLRRAVERYDLMRHIPVPLLPVNLAEQVAGGVRLVLYTDRSVYRRGGAVGTVAGVENRSPGELAFTRWNIGDPAIYVRAEPADPGSPVPPITLEEKGLSPVRLPAVNTGALATGSAITQRITWQTVFPAASPPGDTQRRADPLPPGRYRITATFYLQSAATGPEPTEISASVEIEIAGDGALLVGADEARDLALREPDVAQWWDAHAGRNLVRRQDGRWYVREAEGWQEASEAYATEVANQGPELQVTFVRGVWEILMVSKLGDPPHRLVVHVNPYTGEIIDRQFHER